MEIKSPVLIFARLKPLNSISTIKTMATLLYCTALSMPLSADTLFGLYAGGYHWNTAFDGDFSNRGESNIDVDNNLGFDDDSNRSLYLAVEHPIPLLPNVKVELTTVEFESRHTLSAPITFQGTTFTASATNSRFDLSSQDGTFYYELLDNWVSLDLGLTLRRLDGEISIQNSLQAQSADIDETLPLLYSSVQFDLPFTGFYAKAIGNGLAIDDQKMTDFSFLIGYESRFRVGVEIGYRTLNVKMDELSVDSFDINSDLDSSGLFLGVTLHI